MISYKTISVFRERLADLLKVKKGVYSGVVDEISKEFSSKDIDQIRQNNDMVFFDNELIMIKLRLPDKKHRLAKKDGFRLIYLVSKISDLVVFLDIYPKNGPLQQLDEEDAELKRFLRVYIQEANDGLLEDYCL